MPIVRLEDENASSTPPPIVSITTSTSSTSPMTFSAWTTTTGPEIVIETKSVQKEVSDKVIAKGVYNYLRFLRSLGKTQVTAGEIAKALSLPLSLVERIASTLRGVKKVER